MGIQDTSRDQVLKDTGIQVEIKFFRIHDTIKDRVIEYKILVEIRLSRK